MFYKDGYQSEISRFIDDKRSTIKEQMEEEEEFTGSSMNMSTTLGKLKAPKKCKNKKKKSKKKLNGGSIERSHTNNVEPIRKFSGAISSHEKDNTPMNVKPHHRKLTENVGDTTFHSNKHNDISTTLDETSGKVPKIYTWKESDLDGYAASVSMMSTPTLVNKIIRTNNLESASKNDLKKSQVSVQKSLEGVIKEKENEESRKESNSQESVGEKSALAIIKLD